MSKLHVIENESWQVGILPDAGASVAFGRVKRDGRWLDFMRPTPETSYRDPSACASYVLIPWSNRIRDGHFRFQNFTSSFVLTTQRSELLVRPRPMPIAPSIPERNSVFPVANS